MNRPEEVALTAAQEKLWDETRVALLWECPAFAHIFYTMMNKSGSKHIAYFTKGVPIAAVDDTTLFVNPETFFKYDLKERVFICAHEICHVIFNHIIQMNGWRKRGGVSDTSGKKYPYIHQLMNVAADLVINDLLVNCRNAAGSPIFKFNKDWLHDKSVATEADSVIDAYVKLFQKCPKIKINPVQGQGQGQGQGDMEIPVSGKSFDEHLTPGTGEGKDPNQASQDRNEAEWKAAIDAAVNAARVQGKLPAGLERLLDKILNPEVDWSEQIRALFARKVGSGTYDWRRADRRLIVRDIIAPGRSGYGAGDVVVAVDTSGSIGPSELRRFFSEMGGILEDVKPKRLFVVWCDAAIGRIDEISEPSDLYDIQRKGAPGGGGTSFVPVFDWMVADDIQCDALVYLTDGYGTFPSYTPAYPVVWGNISGPGTVKYPFGDVVDVPVKAA